MKKIIFKGKVDHSDKAGYPPFLLSIILFPVLLFSGFNFVMLCVFLVVFALDYLLYRHLMSLEYFQLVETDSGLEFQLWKHDNLEKSISNVSIDFWFRQKNNKGYGSVYGLKMGGEGGEGLGGGGTVNYQLFMEITGKNDERFLFSEELNVWGSYPNGWRYAWEKQEEGPEEISTFDLKKAKIAYEEFMKLNKI